MNVSVPLYISRNEQELRSFSDRPTSGTTTVGTYWKIRQGTSLVGLNHMSSTMHFSRVLH